MMLILQRCAKYRVRVSKRVRVSQKFNYYTANWLYTYTVKNPKNCDISYKRKNVCTPPFGVSDMNYHYGGAAGI